MTLDELMRAGQVVEAHRPWPRVVVETATWRALAQALADGKWTLSGLWGDVGAVHMALFDDEAGSLAVATLECPDATFPSVGALHPPAIRLERTVHDLFGLAPEGAPDMRPWLDHGRWGVSAPLTASDPPRSRGALEGEAATYPFLPVEGEHLHEIPVGPVHAGIIEPGHFRFTASGETVARLEQRLGYVHKGIESLMAGATLMRGARLASHTSGDSAVAYSIAFARAVEAALGVEAPPRANWLRALMAELERLANHLGDFGAICNDASFVVMHAECGILREHALRTANACFGHRLMMDRVVPGGVAADLDAQGAKAIRDLLARLRGLFPALVSLYDETTSLQDRTVTTGIVKPEWARQFGAGGYVGRASGRPIDSRRTPGYAPYEELRFEVPVLKEGDVNARVWIRIREIEQSLSLIGQILERIPDGPIATVFPAEGEGNREGLGIAEAFRGDVLAWVRIAADGCIVRGHLRDPSWFQWPLLEAAIEGNIVADFPLCNKSFNCSYSGHDL
jgi:Ni,Fe-hydrogenase III large subunit